MLVTGLALKFAGQRVEEILDLETLDFRLDGTGVQPRNIEHRRENVFNRFKRRVDIADDRLVITFLLAFDQCAGEEPRRIERLQNVVAGGGEEARLALVGGIGIGLRLAQFAVELGQFGGAFGNAHFQCFVGELQGISTGHGVGHVRKGDNDATIGQAAAVNVDHAERLHETLPPMALAAEQLLAAQRNAFGLSRFGLKCARTHEEQQFINARAHLEEFGWQRQHVIHSCVPQDQPARLIEHHNALWHIVDGGLQDAAAVFNGTGGVIQQLNGITRSLGMAFEKQCHDQPR
jgi:hypothetical protein